MRDVKRIKPFLERIEEVWTNHFPDWRFGQLMNNLQRYAENDLFYYEEDALIELLDKFVKEYSQ